MNRKYTTLAAMVLSTASMAFANTPLLVNTNFATWDGWVFGANRFQPVTTWLEFVSAPTAFAYADRVQPSGSGFNFKSWDDGVADKIEAYIFQEFLAGPSTGAHGPSVFATGDVIVFNGSASATRVGANTSDMIVRAFIKVLGYNELGWAFQTKEQYSAFQTIGSALQPFNLSVTFPDLAVDDSLQVLQLGFEITTIYDGTANAMDSGTIYFENLEGYIEGGTVEPTLWNGYVVDATGHVDTGDFMGIVYVSSAPWVYVHNLSKWVFLPEQETAAGAWVHLVQ